MSIYLGGRGSAKVALSTHQRWRTTALRTKNSGWTIFSIPDTDRADVAIFVHLPRRAEIRQGRLANASKMAVYRTPHKKQWVDNIFDPWHGSRGRRNFCPPTSEGGDPPRSLYQRIKNGGLPRSAQKTAGGQYFRSLTRIARTSQFLSTYLGGRRSAKVAWPTHQRWRSTALRTKNSGWTIFSIPGTVAVPTQSDLARFGRHSYIYIR